MDHHTTIEEVGEGGVQAVCSCGWRSPVFGMDKTAGTMDPLQRAADAAICTNGRCPCDKQRHAPALDAQNAPIWAASAIG